MGTKLHKIEFYVFGFNDQTESTVKDFKDNLNLIDDFSYYIGESETIDVGEWCDDHPLNHTNTKPLDVRHLFEIENPAEYCEEQAIKRIIEAFKAKKVDYGLMDIVHESDYKLEKVKAIVDRMRIKGVI